MRAQDIRVTRHAVEQFENRIARGKVEVTRDGLQRLAAAGFRGIDFGFVDERTGERVSRPRDGQKVVLTTILFTKGTRAERISFRHFKAGTSHTEACFAECRKAFWAEHGRR